LVLVEPAERAAE